MENWKENLRLTELHTDDCDDWDVLERFIEDLLKEVIDETHDRFLENIGEVCNGECSLKEQLYKRYGISNTQEKIKSNLINSTRKD